VNYYKSYYTEEIEEEHLAGYDAMLQHRRPVTGSPTWCRYKGIRSDWTAPHPWTRLLGFFQPVPVSAGRMPLTDRSARSGLPELAPAEQAGYHGHTVLK
jgi:hypothetical protein